MILHVFLICVYMCVYSRTIAHVELMFLLIKPTLNKVYFTLLYFTYVDLQIFDNRTIKTPSYTFSNIRIVQEEISTCRDSYNVIISPLSTIEEVSKIYRSTSSNPWGSPKLWEGHWYHYHSSFALASRAPFY